MTFQCEVQIDLKHYPFIVFQFSIQYHKIKRTTQNLK